MFVPNFLSITDANTWTHPSLSTGVYVCIKISLGHVYTWYVCHHHVHDWLFIHTEYSHCFQDNATSMRNRRCLLHRRKWNERPHWRRDDKVCTCSAFHNSIIRQCIGSVSHFHIFRLSDNMLPETPFYMSYCHMNIVTMYFSYISFCKQHKLLIYLILSEPNKTGKQMIIS